MHESSSDFHPDSDIPANREDQPSPSRSYAAMILSAILPGLGQIYLNQIVKGCVLFFVFVSAIGIFYINSYPVKEWRDLLRFKPAAQAQTATNDTESAETDTDGDGIALWILDNGDTVKFKPNWILKITSTIQALICWLYAVSGGWRGKTTIRNSNLELE